MMWHTGWSALDWVLMSVAMLVFWALVVGGVIWAVRASRTPADHPRARSARDLLDDRFARGELTDDEYERSRRLLEAM